MAPQRPLRLLSLDGGGIRGLSSIMILKEIMRQVNRGRRSDQQLLPCQVFDLIGGTSTGGIIAVMLGRLRMSLKECEDAYLKLGKEIFEPKRAKWDSRRLVDFVQANEKFDSDVLERSIKAIIKGRTGDENFPLKPSESMADGDCKVFVCSVLESNSEAVYLRSYEPGHLADPLSDDVALWQALRATSAASTFFDAYQHGTKKFVDGGFAYNNPVQRVKIEASDLWGTDRPALLISIGTGESKGESLGGNIKELAQSMIKLVTQTEKTAEDFYSLNRDMVNRGMYFRFNVPGLATIGMQEYKELHAIESQTIAYLTRGATGRELQAVVNKIQNIQATDDIDPARLEITDLDEEAKRDALLVIHNPSAICLQRTEPLQKYHPKSPFSTPKGRHHELTSDLDCFQALFSTAGDYNCHRLQLDQPVNRTCSWILEHPNFASFRRTEDPTLLWVTGNPGCGKSILARFLADHLEFETGAEENMTLAPIICWFFFKDGQDNRTQSQSAVSALLHQLFTAWPILTKFGQAEYATKGSAFTNSPEAVWKVLCRACSSIPRREVICIVDALDECSEESRNRLIRMMMSTFSAPDAKKTVGCLKVLVTSRPLPEIEAQFESDNINRLRVEDETLTVAQDVARVIEHRLHRLKSKKILTLQTCEVVERMLKEKADGTFLWISLVLESIVSLPSRKLKTVKQTLNAIPKDLDHLYARAIPELDEADRRISRRLLSILLVATRPLSLDEINICLSLDLDTEELADLEEEPDINHTVKTLGGLFIRIAQSQVSFVHQTAREYLLRDSSSTSPGKSRQHSIDSLGANLTLAQSCLRYLLLHDWVTYLELASDCEPNMYATRLLGDLPEAQSSFYRYAAANWPIHIGAGGPNYLPEPELRKEMDALCDQSSKPFAIWWSCYTGFNLYNAYSGGSYFHYVAAEGDWVVLKELLTGRSSDVDAYDEAGRTPLLEAAMNGHEAVAKLLIDKGAAVDSIDDDGCVPLLHAAENGHEAMAKLLLDNSADIDAASKDGRTPLLGAAANGHEVVVTLLLRNNAAVDAADEYHRTPLLLAAENGHEAVVKLLLNKGADMNAADRDGWTPLLQATKNGHEEVVKQLLGKAAPVNAGNKYGWTPLLEAARKGHEGVAKLLLDNGAGLEAMDGYGWTPLWWATNDSRVAVAKLLLEKGADVDAKADSSSQTPLVWALEHDQKAIVKLLLEHGANVPQTLLVGGQGRDVQWVAVETITPQQHDVSRVIV